ncbi:TPA: TIM barrel protein [Clostridioides difficile]|nr:sugar phosphate isomerase/epimerase [Clostridioides difficile]HBF6471384.1 TIM barrel protein [Clostridioides difficile]HBH3656080.1 TIM barrel protein [Clostridioides difficile]
MAVGIASLLFNIEEALNICESIKQITHLEIGIDNISECSELCKYKERISKLGLSIGIHLPMELNTCENIEYIRNSWINFIEKIEFELKGFDIRYFNLHLGYVMTNRVIKDRDKYLGNSVDFLDKLNTNSYVCIENTYSKGGDFSNIGNISYDFEYIFKRIKNSKICFCYDTGHCLIDEDAYVKNLKDKIRLIHLSDNDGINDTHVGIGRGILSEEGIKEVLTLDAEYLVLEINYEDIEDTISKLNNIVGEG